MTFDALLQPLISGILTGTIYVLTALGLTVIFSIMNVLNFAHGEIYMFGAFCVYFLCSMLHIPYPVALLISIVAVGLFGIVLERVFFHDLLNTAGGILSLSAVILDDRSLSPDSRELADLVRAAAGQLVEEIEAQRTLASAER